MILTSDAVVFKSADDWYELERSGDKPATVRVMTLGECTALMLQRPPAIEIRHADYPTLTFTREILSMHVVDGVLPGCQVVGSAVVLICWRP